MLAKRVPHRKHPDTGASNHLRLSAPRGVLAKPRSLHLTKYSTNHNHREFKGHRFWPAYLLCRVQPPVFYGFCRADRAIIGSASVLCFRRFPLALMTDEIQQSSAPLSGSDLAGNCSNPAARPLSESCKWIWRGAVRAGRSCTSLVGEDGSTSRNICGVSVACTAYAAAGIRRIGRC